uniref:Uncharacterized protein n=1 Tax=Faecalibaculum rodentium TaxID=1702221 RepID=A0A140DYR0_9FIRM|nr:hypothetical protein AALO17_26530 [Faecalibaculum rodentium]
MDEYARLKTETDRYKEVLSEAGSLSAVWINEEPLFHLLWLQRKQCAKQASDLRIIYGQSI